MARSRRATASPAADPAAAAAAAPSSTEHTSANSSSSQPTNATTSATTSSWRFRCANFYVILMLFAVPLFSVPCSKGSCTAPVEVVASYLFTQGPVGEELAKAILYPGAILKMAESMLADDQGFSFPEWDSLLQDFQVKRNLGIKEDQSSVNSGLFVFGCLLCMVGAVLSVLGPSFVSSLGMSILLWYIYEEGKTKDDVHLLPMFGLAMLCSFAAIDFDWLPSKLSSMIERWTEVKSEPENKKDL